MFAYAYFPGAPVRVTAPLETATTVDILNGPDDQGVPEISQPDQYGGSVVSYRLGRSALYTFLFTRDVSLQTEGRYRLGGDAQVFSNRLNLLQAPLNRADGGELDTETPTESRTG